MLTHDRETIPLHAYERINAGQVMPGIFLVSDIMPIGQAIAAVTFADAEPQIRKAA